MARFSRMEVLNSIFRLGLVPVFYHQDLDTAIKIVSACSAAGARVVEFTNRGDLAYEVFAGLVRHFARADPGVILGVGSVVDAGTAALYISSGANFVVGPVLNPEVARVCNRRKVPYAPGCGSASEISAAEELGVEIVKVFPGAEVGGPGFVKAMLGPCPWTRIMPTGGVEATRESVEAWFKAGVAAVGVGSNLIRGDLVARGDFAAISANVARMLWWIKEARGEALFTGIEHPGLHPFGGASAQEIAAWYGQVFGFRVSEGRSSFFVAGQGPGRIEVMKEPVSDRFHIAIRVADFDAAVAALQARGIELEEPNVKPESKAVYLEQTDPAGNRVHLLWQAQ